MSRMACRRVVGDMVMIRFVRDIRTMHLGDRGHNVMCIISSRKEMTVVCSAIQFASLRLRLPLHLTLS